MERQVIRVELAERILTKETEFLEAWLQVVEHRKQCGEIPDIKGWVETQVIRELRKRKLKKLND